jgi:hypothetical protein
VIFGFISVSQTPGWEADYTDATTDPVGSRFWTAVDEVVSAEAQAAQSTLVSALWDAGAIWYPDAAAPGGVSRRPRSLTMTGAC